MLMLQTIPNQTIILFTSCIVFMCSQPKSQCIRANHKFLNQESRDIHLGQHFSVIKSVLLHVQTWSNAESSVNYMHLWATERCWAENKWANQREFRPDIWNLIYWVTIVCYFTSNQLIRDWFDVLHRQLYLFSRSTGTTIKDCNTAKEFKIIYNTAGINKPWTLNKRKSNRLKRINIL